ncbi:MAG: type II secretion system protein GspK [Smithellaceae bacterium]
MDRIVSVLSSNRGIALLITLWMLVIMMVTAFSFSSLVRTEVYSAFSHKENLENKYFAEAGLERGIAEVFYRIAFKNQTQLPGNNHLNTAVFEVDGTSYTEKLGEGYYRVSIADDGGKININELSDQNAAFLSTRLINGGLTKEKAEEIVDAVLDWKDEDDHTRLRGAETGYYQTLNVPYQAANRPFEALEELLLVRGVDPELLYGADHGKGIIQDLTIHSKSPQIKLDVASKDVLMAIPGMTEDIFDGILAARQGPLVDKIREYQNMLGNRQPALIPYLDIGESGIYTIRSIGYRQNEKTGYVVEATIMVEGNSKFSYLYYKSPGHITP